MRNCSLLIIFGFVIVAITSGCTNGSAPDKETPVPTDIGTTQVTQPTEPSTISISTPALTTTSPQPTSTPPELAEKETPVQDETSTTPVAQPTEPVEIPTSIPDPTATTPQPITAPQPEPESDPLSIYEGDCVFCFVDESDPSMPVWDMELQGYTHQPDDPREQIVIDETFVVGPGEEVFFENQIIWVRPDQRQDIEVYGKLVIRDSLLLWDQTEHQQTRLRIKNGGELIIEDSFSFWNNQYWVNWEFEDGATVYYDHFVGDPWTSIQGSVDYTAVNYSTVKLTLLRETKDTMIEVSDSHHVYLELFPAAGEYEISFPEKRQWADWELSDLWPNTIVNVRDSYLYERDVSISNDTHITVLDTPSGFSLGWAIGNSSPGFIDCELSDLGDPYNDDGVFYENMVWDLPCNNSSLTVRNSVLQRAWPVTWGNVHLRINHSNLVDPRNYGGPATLEIYDSTIDHIAAYRKGKVYIENSEIRYDIEVKDSNSAIYGYRISARDEDRSIEILELDGGTYVELESSGPPW